MLQVDALGYHRDGSALLTGVSCTFRPGRLSVLLGPNGAGKSTLLQLLAGLQAPQQGRVALDRVPIGEIPLPRRARLLAYMTQAQPLNFPFSAAEVVAMGCYPLQLGAGASMARAEQLLAEVELADKAQQNYLTLSGGERQRVQLARVLAQCGGESRVLLLDEPLAAMDLRHQHLALQQLQRLAAAGLAVIAVLHDPLLAARYADELLLLKAGRLVASGAVRDLWQSRLLSGLYDLPLTADWLGEEPLLLARRGPLSGSAPPPAGAAPGG